MRNFSGILLILIALQLATWRCGIAVLVPSTNDDVNDDNCLNVSDLQRLDCCPENINSSTTNACDAALCTDVRNCCWVPTTNTPNAPWCFYPSKRANGGRGYTVEHIERHEHSQHAVLRLNAPSNRGSRDVARLAVDVEYLTSAIVQVRIGDVERKRFVAPYPQLLLPKKSRRRGRRPLYRVQMPQVGEDFYLKILRRAQRRRRSEEIIFDTNATTTAAPLIFTEQFIEFSGQLPFNSNNSTDTGLYGLGYHQTPFQLPFNWTSRYVFWNADGAPDANVNLYASQPFYMALTSPPTTAGGAARAAHTAAVHAHGVYFHNSGALEVVLNPSRTVTWRAISGVIDMYFFLGPSPESVVEQYTQLVGRPYMPPYWSLGFHLCRYGYGSLNRTRYINSINRAAGIPVEVQWNDIDALHKFDDFSYDHVAYAGLPDFIDELHRDGLRYMIMMDPGINAGQPSGTYPPFDVGAELDVFVKNSSGQFLLGESWTGDATVWPDFSHPQALHYWTRMLKRFHRKVEFDGLWIDMNEPSNFINGSIYGCPGNSSYEAPPYLPPLPRQNGQLHALTLCMTAKHHVGLHYNVHNAYSVMENEISNKAFTRMQQQQQHTAVTNLEAQHTKSTEEEERKMRKRKRPFVLTRANFAGTGRYASAWNGDGRATWLDLKLSIPYILNYNLFGIPHAGVDLCGFHTPTTPELCTRWVQLGAFYPFTRSHNDLGLPDKDPASMGEPVLSAARQALTMRYRLLPYFYTLFYRAHKFAETVARSMLFEFPHDAVSRYCDWQFLLGDALLVVPVLDPNVTQVAAYLPAGSGWYDFYTGEVVRGQPDNESWAILDAPYDKVSYLP